MPRRDPQIARALGPVREVLELAIAERPGPIHVACSGGADSMVLLGLLACLRGPLGLELSVGHVDHGLRAESADEGELVARTAANLGLACARARLDLAVGPGLPARARDARYAALRAQARAAGAVFIALGHTATDQIETVLLHLARGTGLDGLSGMAHVEGDVLRPLLGFERDRLRQLATALGLTYVDDPTNDDPSHPRVAIRQRVLPVLRQINPGVERAAYGAAKRAAAADQALAVWAERELDDRTRKLPRSRPDLVCDAGPWNTDGWHEMPRAVGSRVVRRICTLGGVDASQLRAEVVDAIDAAAVRQSRFRATGTPESGVEPRRWDLHPKKTLVVDKHGVYVVAGPLANH